MRKREIQGERCEQNSPRINQSACAGPNWPHLPARRWMNLCELMRCSGEGSLFSVCLAEEDSRNGCQMRCMCTGVNRSFWAESRFRPIGKKDADQVLRPDWCYSAGKRLETQKTYQGRRLAFFFQRTPPPSKASAKTSRARASGPGELCS